MISNHRRDFLKLCLASLPFLAFPHRASGQGTTGSDQHRYRKPGALDRYIDPLPVPKRLMRQGASTDGDEYFVRMLEFTHRLHSQLPPTKLWGYEGQYPGPTIEAMRGRPIAVQWENHLPSRHIFDVDAHIRGAALPAPAVRTVPHLHGARNPSEYDGLPESWFTSGQSARYRYPNSQPAATLWYHDHAAGITRLNMYAGLSGFFLLRDEQEQALNLPSGDYEIPLIIQDRRLDEKGQLVYAPTFDDGQRPPPGLWGPQLFGDLPVVNGAIYPFLEVEPRPYRVRLLNGANYRFFNLFLNLASNPADLPSLVTFHQIGTDGGFLARPVAMNKILLGPAERADLIVDFSGLEGRAVTLSNDAPAPFPGWNTVEPHHLTLYELMQFRVTLPLAAKRSFSLPALHPIAKLEETKSIRSRDFILAEGIDQRGRSVGLQINGKGYGDAVTEVVRLGSTERWRFVNATEDAHPIHLHMAQFQILQRQGFNPVTLRNGTVELVGIPRQPAAYEAGWKDTAVVNPREVLTLLVRFEGYAGRFVFESQLLEQADKGTMRPYLVAEGEANLQAQ
jgi:spore coat protein A